jgi:hypothetical protein
MLTALSALVIFSDRVSCFLHRPFGSWSSYLYLLGSWDCSMNHHTQFICWDWIFLTFSQFWLPTVILPVSVSWDDRCMPHLVSCFLMCDIQVLLHLTISLHLRPALGPKDQQGCQRHLPSRRPCTPLNSSLILWAVSCLQLMVSLWS